MNISVLTDNLPLAAVGVGALLLLWSKRSVLFSFVAKLWPTIKTSKSMTPTKRFETFYALRSWCEDECHMNAVEALDDKVLPMIVCSDGDKK